MIVRTFGCSDCGHMMEVRLRSDQWDMEPPACPMCEQQTYQEFKAPAILGSNVARATDLAHKIAAEDYNVADIRSPSRSGRSVTYRDQTAEVIPPSTWAAAQGQMAQAIALGRETRLRHGGNGLDVLQGALKSGAQPDLIANSRKMSIRTY